MMLSLTILRRTILGIVFVAIVCPSAMTAQSGTWALTNARIETVTKGVVEKGTIVIRDGLIVAVGADVAVPADARVLDLSKRTVSPGLIDLTSTAGLSATAAPAAAGGGRGGAGAPAPVTGGPSFSGFDADRKVSEELHVSPADARSARESGVTVALVAPSRGALRGLSALIPMKDSADGSDALRSPVAEHFGFSGGGGGFGGGGGYPGTIMGVIAYQRQALYDARRHGQLADRWATSPRGLTRPENDPKLAALVPVVRGTLPLFYDANVENEIRRAVKINKEFDGVKMTIVGATEGWQALDALAGHTVVVSLNFPNPTSTTGWSYRDAMRHAESDSAAADLAARKLIEGNAAAINKAGIRFALASGGTGAAAFVTNARKAIAAGLPADVALAAMTIRAAELAGLGEALGSIEVGKIANLVVTEGGGILADSAKVRTVFVDGARFEIAAAPAAAPMTNSVPGGRGGAATTEVASAQVGGTWHLVVDSPQGAQALTMTVVQSGSAFTGKVSGMPTGGDLDVANGLITGRNVTWEVSINMNGQSLTISFNGEVTGTKISGTAALGQFGNAPFSGDKTP